MSDTHVITDAPAPARRSTRSKVAKWTAIGVFTAGVLLIIDDKVRGSRKRKHTETTETVES